MAISETTLVVGAEIWRSSAAAVAVAKAGRVRPKDVGVRSPQSAHGQSAPPRNLFTATTGRPV